MLLDHPIGNLERCWECSADCCRSFPTVNITWSEYNRLQALGASRLYFTLSGRCQLIIENGCEFLSNYRCRIYDDRPDVCKRFICADTIAGDNRPRPWSRRIPPAGRIPLGS